MPSTSKIGSEEYANSIRNYRLNEKYIDKGQTPNSPSIYIDRIDLNSPE
jgi:hypothetical protein